MPNLTISPHTLLQPLLLEENASLPQHDNPAVVRCTHNIVNSPCLFAEKKSAPKFCKDNHEPSVVNNDNVSTTSQAEYAVIVIDNLRAALKSDTACQPRGNTPVMPLHRHVRALLAARFTPSDITAMSDMLVTNVPINRYFFELKVPLEKIDSAHKNQLYPFYVALSTSVAEYYKQAESADEEIGFIIYSNNDRRSHYMGVLFNSADTITAVNQFIAFANQFFDSGASIENKLLIALAVAKVVDYVALNQPGKQAIRELMAANPTYAFIRHLGQAVDPGQGGKA